MERIQSVNIGRIEWACTEFGITHAELAKNAGVPESTIERLINGEGITLNNLRKIADYFGLGVLFFMEQEAVGATEVYTPQFRTILNRKPHLSAKLRKFVNRIQMQREIYIALLETLEEPVVAFTPPTFTEWANQASQDVRDWLNLTANNDFTLARTKVEEKGILVFLSNGYAGPWQIPKDDPVLGFSVYQNPYPVIVVKKSSDQRQLFTLLHELAHLLIHKESWVDDVFDLESYVGQEREASDLAGRILVPDAVLERINDQAKPAQVTEYDEWLADIRRESGVSGDVILLRLVGNGRLPHENYDAYKHWKASLPWAEDARGSRQYRHREPLHMFGDRYVHTVLEALEAKEITLTRASSYLDNLKVGDIRELERYCYARV